jgi:hypothetical protein
LSEAINEGMSRKGLDFLRQIVVRKDHELTDEQEAKMKKEIREDPKLFDPTEKNSDVLMGTSVYLPLWIAKYLKMRKAITGKPVSKQIEEIVREYIASEILELLEGGST